MAELTDDEIADAARNPKMVRTVEGTAEERSISELIAADKYAAQKNTSAVPWGMKIARTKPGGTVT